jgi:hypothetical protein
MPARHGIAATPIVTLLILPCGLILRRQIAVRIANAVARAQIPAMAAWRRMDGDTVLHGFEARQVQPSLVQQRFRASCSTERPVLRRQC